MTCLPGSGLTLSPGPTVFGTDCQFWSRAETIPLAGCLSISCFQMQLHYRVWDYHSQLPLKRWRIGSTESQEAVPFFKQSKCRCLKNWHKPPKQNCIHTEMVIQIWKSALCSELLIAWKTTSLPVIALQKCFWNVVLQNISLLYNTVKERWRFVQGSKWSPGLGPVLTTDTPWGILICWLCASTFL